MIAKVLFLCTIAVLLVGHDRPASARTLRGATTCQPDAFADSLMLNRLRRIVTDTGSWGVRERAMWRLPLMSPSEVMVVTDAATCDAALSAYQAQYSSAVTFPAVRVFKAGTHYVIGPSAPNAGEWSLFFVFNAAMTQRVGRRLV